VLLRFEIIGVNSQSQKTGVKSQFQNKTGVKTQEPQNNIVNDHSLLA